MRFDSVMGPWKPNGMDAWEDKPLDWRNQSPHACRLPRLNRAATKKRGRRQSCGELRRLMEESWEQ